MNKEDGLGSSSKFLIGFDDYRISCVIGVYPEERVREQEIFVDLRVGHDAVQNDELSTTLCYVELAALCADLACKEQFKLLETFAAAVMQQIVLRYGKRSIWIRIRKPGGLIHAAATVVEAKWDGH